MIQKDFRSIVSSIIYIVIDTNVILREWQEILRIRESSKQGLSIFLVTSPEVLAEIRSQLAKTIFITLQDHITAIAPNQRTLSEVQKTAEKLGIDKELSYTDISLASLAYELTKRSFTAILWTDDLKLQNLCFYLGIPIISRRKKIKYLILRAKKCLNCGTIYPYNLEHCPNCGSYNFKTLIKKIKVKGDNLGSLIFQDNPNSKH